MLSNNDKYQGKEKFYVIEYNNGEPYEDECNDAIGVIFRSLENAKEYIRKISLKVDPRDYKEEVRGKLPQYRYYTRETREYGGNTGNIKFYLEEDKFEDFSSYVYETDSYYTIVESWLLD